MFEDVLVERGATIHRVELDEGEPLPDWHGYDVIVAMGGPMSAYDEDELPWLTQEKQLIADAVRAGTPFFGVCLGVQLLAASLGARVYAGDAPEVGLLPVELTAEGRADPVLACLPDGAVTLQWHGDTFDLPDGAVAARALAGLSPSGFSLRECVRRAIPPRGLRRDGAGVVRAPGVRCLSRAIPRPGRRRAFVSSIEERSSEMRASGRRIFERFLDSVVAPTRARAVAT